MVGLFFQSFCCLWKFELDSADLQPLQPVLFMFTADRQLQTLPLEVILVLLQESHRLLQRRHLEDEKRTLTDNDCKRLASSKIFSTRGSCENLFAERVSFSGQCCVIQVQSLKSSCQVLQLGLKLVTLSVNHAALWFNTHPTTFFLQKLKVEDETLHELL